MARQALQEELQNIMHIGQKAGRKKLAQTYCNEIVLHTQELSDAIFEYYKKETGYANLTPSSPLIPIFKRGSRRFMSSVMKKIKEHQSFGRYKSVYVSRFKGGVVIYMTGPGTITFESPTWRSATGVVAKARDAMVKKMNVELDKGNWPTIDGKGFATGHHGGTQAYDPKSTYGTGTLQNTADTKRQKLDKNLLDDNVEMDEFTPGKVSSYTDIFWWNMYDVLEEHEQILWHVSQQTNRPDRTATLPGHINDKHIYRVVYGKVSANIMNPYDRSGRAKHAVGRELNNLVLEARRRTETHVRNYVRTVLQHKIVDFKASSSAKERIGKIGAETVVNALNSNVKKQGGKVRSTSNKAKGGTRKVSAKTKKKKSRVQKGSKKGTKSAKPTGNKKQKRGRTRSGQIASANPMGLKSIIQKALPETVEKNMGLPGLVNRTGRFAKSAEINEVVPMPKSVEIRYTYQRDPYEVFEPEFGNALASRSRDPKRIIGASIREIAQSIMGTRFGIVRTKRE